MAYGWLAGAAAQHLRAHALTCSTCGPRLAAEQELRRQLALLRRGEPPVDLVAAVLRQLPPIRRASGPAAGRSGPAVQAPDWAGRGRA